MGAMLRMSADLTRLIYGLPKPITHRQVDADLISTTGVPSNASIGSIFTRVPSISRTVTGCRPSAYTRLTLPTTPYAVIWGLSSPRR